MKNQIGKLEVPFQVDASMTIMSFHVYCCRLANLAKVNSESKALNVLNPTAAWIAQLVEHQSAVREVEGSSPRPDQHSGS